MEGNADLTDGIIDAPFGVYKYAIGPEHCSDVFACNQLAAPLGEKNEQFHGLALEFQDNAVGSAQLVTLQVQLMTRGSGLGHMFA